MTQDRKKTGRHLPGTLTSSKKKNQSLSRTRRKKDRQNANRRLSNG